VRGARQERLAVLGGEQRDEPCHAAQVHPAVTQHLENHGEPTRRARDGDATVGLGFRETQAFGAVREHGREGLPRVQPSRIDLADVSDELGLDAPRLRD
jgi:hypothetical protein